MRYFLISICLLFLACGSYPKKQGFATKDIGVSTIQNSYFSNETQDYVYKANIEVYDNTFGGIFIVKKIDDTNHRIVFTTEMGTKIFDFSFVNDDFTVNYIMDDLNKKILINILKKDFKVLIANNLQSTSVFTSNNVTVMETSLYNKKHYYYKSDYLEKIVRTGNGKEKVNFLFSEINDSIANRIQILHSNIKLSINLKSIN